MTQGERDEHLWVEAQNSKPEGRSEQPYRPKILTFSTNSISDLGVDMAGAAHMPYPPTVRTLSVPCSSGIKPEWIVHALESGFDGVFLAADGTDCALVPDCTERTAKILDRAQKTLKEREMNPSRVKMAAICSVCAESFTSLVTSFSEDLAKLGPMHGGR